jgi:predicted amidohydrolase
VSEIGDDDYDPRPANAERARAAIEQAASAGANLVVFGEVFLNGYGSGGSAHRYAVTEDDADPWVRSLIREAETHHVHLLVGATTRQAAYPGDVYNSVLVIGPDGLRGVYRKTHLAAFSSPAGRVVAEPVTWSAGSVLPVFETPLGTFGVEICYDIYFPEVARTLALKGAELIVNVSAAVTGSETYWDHMLYARAVENRTWYAHVSIVGRQHDQMYFGGSRLLSPFGEPVAEAARGAEDVVVAEASRDVLLEARGRTHVFHHRNPQLYETIIRRSVVGD